MTNISELISTLERLRSELPVQGEWAADHDWEWEEEPIAYVHPVSDGDGHNAILTTIAGDFRRVEAEQFEHTTKRYDRGGQAITRYVAALHNALPALIAELNRLGTRTPRAFADGPSADEVAAFKCGGRARVEAVRGYRFRSGLDLTQAKAVLEAVSAETP